MILSTKITPPGDEKFTPPEIPDFSSNAPALSVLSLFGFLAASVAAFANTHELAWWGRAPFLFSAIGSGIGFAYELWLIASGRPYQLFGTAGGRVVQWLRFAVLVLVYGSAYFAYCLLTAGESKHISWIVGISGGLTGLLAVVLLLRGPQSLGTVIFFLGLIGQAALVWSASGIPGDGVVSWLLTAGAVVLFVSIVIGASTPRKSTVFHVLGISSTALLYFAFQTAHQHSTLIAVGNTAFGKLLWLLLGFMVAVSVAFYFLPKTWGVLRAFLANSTWPFFYLIIAGGLYIPRPARLSAVYKGKEDLLKPLKVFPYYRAHARNLTYQISVPSLDEALTLKVHGFGFLTRLVTFFFAVASVANRLFPFANVKVPLAHKPRMEPWSDGSDYWPWWLLRKIWLPGLGRFQIQSGVRGPGFQPTPDQAIDAYRDGQLLAYLVEYGIAGSFIELERHGSTTRMKLDFSFLEKYETKPDYESYGGKAYFEINKLEQRIDLISVQAPGSDQEIIANVNDAAFRRAEDLILASLYYYVVSGKHLVEIHMGLNLVEIALFNAFDVKTHWNHPVRMAFYPHLFAHELAEELTTENLLEDGAVFSQIFATTNAALMQHLNDRFSEYQLGRDEDFEHRTGVLMSGRAEKQLSDILPHCSLVWEKEYSAIWQEYAESIIDAAYADDDAVAKDVCVQSLFSGLSSLFQQPLADRYGKLATKRGLARFIADLMHHLIIRHEIYGTSGVRLSLDPRINKVQVPKDRGPYAIDEWRSLACVAMATSRVRYTSLMMNFANVFSDIENRQLRMKFQLAHTKMKSHLLQLQQKYSLDGVDNYETLRLLPSDLDIGAGY